MYTAPVVLSVNGSLLILALYFLLVHRQLAALKSMETTNSNASVRSFSIFEAHLAIYLG